MQHIVIPTSVCVSGGMEGLKLPAFLWRDIADTDSTTDI